MLNWIDRNRTDYIIKMDLALNNPQKLICHKIQLTNDPANKHLSAQFDNFFFEFKIFITFSLSKWFNGFMIW